MDKCEGFINNKHYIEGLRGGGEQKNIVFRFLGKMENKMSSA